MMPPIGRTRKASAKDARLSMVEIIGLSDGKNSGPKTTLAMVP